MREKKIEKIWKRAKTKKVEMNAKILKTVSFFSFKVRSCLSGNGTLKDNVKMGVLEGLKAFGVMKQCVLSLELTRILPRKTMNIV